MQQANLRASGSDAESSPQAVARWLWAKIAK
jgi:osmoprotectant transport system permease protein